jgi:hypothetical protein
MPAAERFERVVKAHGYRAYFTSQNFKLDAASPQFERNGEQGNGPSNRARRTSLGRVRSAGNVPPMPHALCEISFFYLPCQLSLLEPLATTVR